MLLNEEHKLLEFIGSLRHISCSFQLNIRLVSLMKTTNVAFHGNPILYDYF